LYKIHSLDSIVLYFIPSFISTLLCLEMARLYSKKHTNPFTQTTQACLNRIIKGDSIIYKGYKYRKTSEEIMTFATL
jgi:hypothetical protein